MKPSPSRLCYRCQRHQHSLCTGSRIEPHNGKKPCECKICKERKEADAQKLPNSRLV